MQTKCINCGKISPPKDDICDACGGIEFVPFDPNATKKIKNIINDKKEEEKKEEPKKEEVKKEEPKKEEPKKEEPKKDKE